MLNTNLIGTICEVDASRALVRVDIGGRKSSLMPVLMTASSFKKHFTPMRVGEQVAVLGGLDSGFCVRGIFHQGCREPVDANSNREVLEYENGAKIVIDTAANTVTISGFNIILNGNLTVNGTITDAVGLLTDHTHTGVKAGGDRTGGR